MLNRFETNKDSMNCTFRLTSSDGANFYLGDNVTYPLVDHDGLHNWWDDRSSEASFVVRAEDIAVGARWQGGYIPFRLEYFNNADEVSLTCSFNIFVLMTTTVPILHIFTFVMETLFCFLFSSISSFFFSLFFTKQQFRSMLSF